VEDAGWDGVWVTDHPFPVVAVGRHGHHAWDPFTALGIVAGATARVVLHANLIVLPYRNPFHVAKAASTLQHLSGGRHALTVGGGYLREEFEALGAGAAYDERGLRLVEGVAALSAAWSGRPVHMEGADWVASGNTMAPASAPQWLLRGGNGKAAIRHAARAFDGWAPVEQKAEPAGLMKTVALAVDDKFRESVAMLRAESEAVGRSIPEIWYTRSVEDWLEKSSGAFVKEQIAELEELGVSWLSVWIAPLESGDAADYLRRLEELHALVH
jgi:alkanesulfonate monooxygenase SsuD/methylene tetrahydromethanopterin reductase-like flavin-dependent oxidoreductase (luciferase family)